MRREPDKAIDLSNEVCPMTFVLTKVALDEMSPGEILEVILPAGTASVDVPRSVKEEGHKIVSAEKIENGIILRIEKG